MSSDVGRVVNIVHNYQLQTSGSRGKVRHWWCDFDGVVVSPTASRPGDTDGGSSFSKLIIGCHDSTWSSWRVFDFIPIIIGYIHH